ncbi:MAG: 2-C-methyl-D-erythritol 2,4-cyclodiphosphate synthase [Actinomycetota bacterium]|nr:2-C-methyl-D-erythritol 2,4-cyclodiphosphate synthase [Actinomycetota bacterium]
MRAGSGFDVHAFAPDRPLIIGGVTIRDRDGLAGHSDADVLCHAIGDALLGAAALGDLGSMFPADDEWRDASGAQLLEAIATHLVGSGWRVGNIDSTVIAQAPRLSDHVPAMVRNISAALAVDADVVSVKATTTDGLGFTGRGEGIAALATVLIQPLV